ncbi:MAG: hypothetical protein JNK04_09800, partial [Myxococcales bacterium]|nr:hypothetical protein [Myxococcales bacterium]
MSDSDTIIHAQLEVFDTTAELWLNGVPVSRIQNDPSRVPIENVAVAQLLIPGSNTLELLVEPGSHPSVGRSEQRELPFRKMSAFARLLRFRQGASGMKEEGELLGEVFFRWED